MKSDKLRVGRIQYANLYPIFHYFEHRCENLPYRFVQGVPSRLNRMLRDGLLDVSPSSSVEYLRRKDAYRIIPITSISSTGRIMSILLFSKYPIEKLGGRRVALSSESDTSSIMLRIILEKFYSVGCRYVSTGRKSLTNGMAGASALMLIGDNAMRQAARAASQRLYIYDLGELWQRFTSLPFVYALWLVREEAVTGKESLFKRFCDDLQKAVSVSSRRFRGIAHDAPQRRWICPDDLVAYWRLISYELTEEHMKGLRLFEEYAREIGCIQNE